jgi:hypothetical protein
MPTSTWGNYGSSLALAASLGQSGLYLGMHTLTPLVLDPGPTEFVGSGYVRQPIAFTLGPRSVANTAGFRFSALPAETCNFLAVWASLSGYDLVAMWDISATPLIVPLNGIVEGSAGDLAMTL